jgi:microcystin degradation protein MlrC
MGPSARLRCGNVEVLVATHATYDWADEQYRSMGMDAAGAKFVVAKNPMNYRVGYAGRFQAAFVLDTPGPTIASVRNVAFQRVKRPYFPVDEEIPGLQPVVYRNR